MQSRHPLFPLVLVFVFIFVFVFLLPVYEGVLLQRWHQLRSAETNTVHGVDHIRLDKKIFLVLIFVHFFFQISIMFINYLALSEQLVPAVGRSAVDTGSLSSWVRIYLGVDLVVMDLFAIFLWIILWCAWVRVVVYLVMVTQVLRTSIIVEKKGWHSDNSTNNMSELSPLVETTTTGVSGFAESRWVRAAWRSRARQPGRVAPELGSEVSGNKNCMFR